MSHGNKRLTTRARSRPAGCSLRAATPLDLESTDSQTLMGGNTKASYDKAMELMLNALMAGPIRAFAHRTRGGSFKRMRMRRRAARRMARPQLRRCKYSKRPNRCRNRARR